MKDRFATSTMANGTVWNSSGKRSPDGQKTNPRAPEFRLRGHPGLVGQSDRVTVRVGDRGDTFAPGHVGWVAEDGDPLAAQVADHRVDVTGVDEHLEPGSVAEGQPVL